MKHQTIAILLGGAALLGAALGVQAQTIYRIVGADGKVTFSDKPPINSDQGKVATTGVGAAAANPNTGLPLELRQIVAKYPVVLFTSNQCTPCDAGRSFLNRRGIPYTERTVTTAEDHGYLQRLTGDTSLPYLTIGAQRIKGMSDLEWTQYLDAAGYPKASVLPPSYRRPDPAPLVTVQAPPAGGGKPQATASEPSYQPPPPPSPSNPAGITF